MNTRTKFVGQALLLLAISAAGAACGSDAQKDGASSATASPLTKGAAGKISGAKADGTGTATATSDANSGAMAAPKSDKNTDNIGDEDDQKKDRIVFTEVELVRDHPNIVEPCLKILRKVYEKANNGKDFEVDFVITYTSKGQSVTKKATVAVKDMKIDDEIADKARYIQVETELDFSSAPPDIDTRFTGSAQLYKVKDKARTLDAEATRQ